MKQLLQSARTGEIRIANLPVPQLLPKTVLVRQAASLVSAGTERYTLEFASKNLLEKARARPDLVRQVISKSRREGLLSAIDAVRTRLDQSLPLGYSSAGTVIAVGEGVSDIQVGDRVACAGAGYAAHAEIACIPRLLLAKIPAADPQVTFEEAAFTTVGAVAMHGIRTADVKLGDIVAVIGLGLLGQITIQLLRAAGCRVLGMDLIPDRADLALGSGATAVSTRAAEFHDLCRQFTAGHGVDAVLITAETPSSEPVQLAGEIARDHGTVVAVGTVGMNIQRKLYYEKELDFRVSRSYGPGRYDSDYEEKARDYPIGFVRWTETRNMEAFLQFVADRKLHLKPLVTHTFPIDRARAAYDLITGRTPEPFLAVVITYPQEPDMARRVELPTIAEPVHVASGTALRVGVIGAGNFAGTTLLPAMRKVEGIDFVGVCASAGSRGQHTGLKFGFRYCTTDEKEILRDPQIETVVIATRHHLHAAQVLRAMEAGKNVFCEKPLCLNEAELAEIIRACFAPGAPQLMVGYNRRFAPMAARLRSFLASIPEPLAMHYRVNAGPVSPNHWIQDPEQGGGRILGEVCHFVDFMIYASGSLPVEVHAREVPSAGQYCGDNVIISLRFANGSQGTITYLASGDTAYGKERLEVFGSGCVAVLDDFRRLDLVRHGRKQTFRSWLRQDKGHCGEWDAFAKALRTDGRPPIPLDQLVATSLTSFRILDSIACGQAVPVNTAEFVAGALASPAEEESAQAAVSGAD